MVRVSVKFVNFGNVKLGCTYVQTVQLHVSSAGQCGEWNVN